MHTNRAQHSASSHADRQNRVNYLLTPSPQGDLCVAKLFPPNRNSSGSSTSLPTVTKGAKAPNVVRCEASRDLRWTIENTGVVSPIYKIVNQDDTPLYQISKPNPNADFWTMFYFKYAGHQIPPRRIEVRCRIARTSKRADCSSGRFRKTRRRRVVGQGSPSRARARMRSRSGRRWEWAMRIVSNG